MTLKASTLYLFALIVVGCNKDSIAPHSPRLDYYSESFDLGNTLGYPQLTELRYEYNDAGQLQKFRLLTFNPATNKMEEQRYSVLTYKGSHIDSLKAYWSATGNIFAKYGYTYLSDFRVSRITEKNYSTVLTSEANFTYPANDSVRVLYTYSNGAGFEYAFSQVKGNIQRDKTTEGPGTLCNKGLYSYDQKVSPFSTLGYLDYELYNFSVNNKLTESVNFTGCAFPSLVPVSYAYEYNDQGYPISATTTYQGSTYTSTRKFYYK